MPDDKRPRSASPVSTTSATAIAYRLTAVNARVDALEHACRDVRAGVDACRAEHVVSVQNVRADVSTLGDAVREIGTVKKLGAWGAGVFIPMLIIAAIAVIQSMTRQDALEKQAEHAEVKNVKVQNRMRVIEYDVGAIKTEQRASHKTLEKVSDTLTVINDRQARMEENIKRRRR